MNNMAAVIAGLWLTIKSTVMIAGLWMAFAIPLAVWAVRTFFHQLGILSTKLQLTDVPRAGELLMGTIFGCFALSVLLFAPTMVTLYNFRNAPSDRSSDLPGYDQAVGSCAKWLAVQAVVAGVLLMVALWLVPSIVPLAIALPLIGTFALSMYFKKDFLAAAIEALVAFSIWWFMVLTFAPILDLGSAFLATTAIAGLFGAVVLPYVAATLLPQRHDWHRTRARMLAAAVITSLPWLLLAATQESVRLQRTYFVAKSLGIFSRDSVDVQTDTLVPGHQTDFSSTPAGSGMSRLNPALLTTLGDLRVACSQQRPFIFPVTMQTVQQRCVVVRDGKVIAVVQYPTK